MAADCQDAVGGVMNVGTGQEISVKELAETILRLLGKDLPIESQKQRERPKKSEVYRLCADNRKAREILGWEPQHTLEEGLLKTIDWIDGIWTYISRARLSDLLFPKGRTALR
jgi:dTDP-glucose 4,6-dehydratase